MFEARSPNTKEIASRRELLPVGKKLVCDLFSRSWKKVELFSRGKKPLTTTIGSADNRYSVVERPNLTLFGETLDEVNEREIELFSLLQQWFAFSKNVP